MYMCDYMPDGFHASKHLSITPYTGMFHCYSHLTQQRGIVGCSMHTYKSGKSCAASAAVWVLEAYV